MRGWVGKVHLRSGEHGFQNNWPQTPERQVGGREVWGGGAVGVEDGEWAGGRGADRARGVEGRGGEEDRAE